MIAQHRLIMMHRYDYAFLPRPFATVPPACMPHHHRLSLSSLHTRTHAHTADHSFIMPPYTSTCMCICVHGFIFPVRGVKRRLGVSSTHPPAYAQVSAIAFAAIVADISFSLLSSFASSGARSRTLATRTRIRRSAGHVYTYGEGEGNRGSRLPRFYRPLTELLVGWLGVFGLCVFLLIATGFIMGSACSYSEDVRHHRENRKNRINPTEPYDKWQKKMLLDIGADPLAVIRDFPRMTVFVNTKTCCHLVPNGQNTSGNQSAVPSRKPQQNQQEQPEVHSSFNPLASRNSKQTHCYVDTDAAGVAETEGESKQQQRRRRRMEKATGPELHIEASTSANATADTSGSWVSPSTSPLLAPHPPPHVMARGGAGAHRSSLQDPSCEDDAFAARMRRVREAVLLLSELCNERATFGASFENAWDHLVVHGSGGRRSNVDSSVAGGSSPGTTQDDSQLPSCKPSRNQPITLDVHQVLLNACLDSGMLMLLSDANSATATSSPLCGTAQSRIIGGVPAPFSLQSGIPPVLVSRSFPPDTSNSSGLQSRPENTAAELASGGATVLKSGAISSDSQQQRIRESATASTSSIPASTVRVTGAFPPATPSPTAALISTPSRYVVRSATFHLMQFATQGVMFFPVQRLKHVLWMPWSSHMQDRAWTIYFHVKDATPEDLIARRQHHLKTQCNDSTSVPLPNTDSAAVLAAARSDGRRDSLSTALPSTVSNSDANGSKLPALSGTADTSAVGWHQSKVIVIRHFQTGRHYVEGSERKKTPVYELDWACNILVDQDTLLKAFAPFQVYAVTARKATVVSPSLPISPGNPFLAQEVAIDSSSLTSHPRQHQGDDDDHETVNVDASPSATASDNVPETALPRRPVEPGAALPSQLIALDVGVLTAQQPQLLEREVLSASAEVVAARMEKPPLTFCMVSSTWRKRKEELDYVLKQQYNVQLMQVNDLPKTALY
ncbi:hypothetical protein, conserved [Leishmania tarentolae]|uniref:Transmembrane protein n=1 Tax=Leishmania tarentolae TaxID=5689 RepID=A0A640KPH9_LEITA|nr:hypothetical protein, conserved [Leishmania tarentolae]